MTNRGNMVKVRRKQRRKPVRKYKVPTGAASMCLRLSNGVLTVTGGTDGKGDVSAVLVNADYRSWERIWALFKEMGFAFPNRAITLGCDIV